MPLLGLLGYGGLASCALGGLLALVGVAKGHQARELDAAVKVESLGELKQLLALVPLIVAVTGRVMAPKPCRCEMSECEAAIVQMREEKKTEQRASGSVWVGNSQLLRESLRETEWALTDGSRVELPVEAGRRAEGDFLQMSGDRLIPDSDESLLGRVVDEMKGSRSVGVRRVEYMLPVGTPLTAVGELRAAVEHPSAFQGAVRRGGKMLVLGEPRSGPFLFSRQPLPELVASLQSSSLACQQWAAAFAAVGASMLVTAGVQYALMWQRQRRLRAGGEGAARSGGGRGCGCKRGAPGTAGSTAAREAGGMGADDGGVSSGLCVVCLERSCDTVFPSCGHMCACSRCSGGLSRCPICRSRGGPIRVYTT